MPAEVRARLWVSLPAMAVTVVPAGSRTATGVLLLAMVPLPNWPKELSPQARMVFAATAAVGVGWASAGSTPAAWVTVTASARQNPPASARAAPCAPTP